MSPVRAAFDRLAALGAPLYAPIDARLNPILVKEVRQSLRGRYFSVVFWLMVAIATLIGSLILVDQGYRPQDDAGVWFFVAMYGCLSVAVHVFVPFSAYLAVGAEWEENTYDLLVLSDLRPRQIVFGKLLATCVQILLFYSAFGPFLVFAFLLRGLDLYGAAWILCGTLVTSFALSCLALCLSSLVRQRFARVIVMALLAAVLIWSCVGSIAFSIAMFQERFFHTPEFRDAALAMLTGALTVAAYSLAFATTRFAHAEENRSSSLRVLTTGVVLVALGWTGYMYHQVRQPELLSVFGVLTLLGLTAISTIFVSEEERLGRRVRLQVPRNPLLALLAAPFLPGGGRGVLHFAFNLAIVAVGLVALGQLAAPTGSLFGLGTSPTPSGPFGSEWFEVPLIVATYAVVYLLLPSGVLSRWATNLRVRVLARLGVPGLAALGFVVPTVLGFLLQDDDMMRGRHLGSPPWVIVEVLESDHHELLVPVVALALGVLLLNTPRVVRALLEVLRTSAERRASPSTGDAGGPRPPAASDAVADS